MSSSDDKTDGRTDRSRNGEEQVSPVLLLGTTWGLGMFLTGVPGVLCIKIKNSLTKCCFWYLF
jgi:hypothetical protein